MRLTDRWDLFFHENSCKLAWVVGREGALKKDARDQMLFYSWHVEVGTQMTSSTRKSIRALSYEIHVCQRKRLEAKRRNTILRFVLLESTLRKA